MVSQSRIVAERFPGLLSSVNGEEHSATHTVLVKPLMKSEDWLQNYNMLRVIGHEPNFILMY